MILMKWFKNQRVCLTGVFYLLIGDSNTWLAYPLPAVTLDKHERDLITSLAYRTWVPQKSGIWLPFEPDTRLYYRR